MATTDKITRHTTPSPKLSARKLAEIRDLRKKIDAEEKDEIIAIGKQNLKRHERVRRVIASLKEARRASGMTLDQMAQVTGIAKPNLSRLENDPVPNPTLDTVLKIADAVGCDVLK